MTIHSSRAHSSTDRLPLFGRFTLLSMRESFRKIVQVMEAMDEYEQDEENQEIIAQMIERAQRALDDVS